MTRIPPKVVDTDHLAHEVDTDELVRENVHLIGQTVAGVSARYPRHVDRQELWNAGALGLVEAAKRFDPRAGIPFDRYAKIRIRGAIIDSTRSRDWASRSVRRRARELDETRQSMTDSAGREPNRESLAKALDISVDELESIKASSATSMLLYLDQESGESEPALRETIADPSPMADPESVLEHREMLGTLREAVEHLPGVHGEVIRRYYLDGEMLQDIAQVHGVTQARISQIRSEALTSLRAHFGQLYEGAPNVDQDAPGKRARASYVAELAAQSTWRSRLAAADGSQHYDAVVGA